MRAKQPSREQIELSDVLYALSDPVRIEILKSIAEVGEQQCGQCEEKNVEDQRNQNLEEILLIVMKEPIDETHLQYLPENATERHNWKTLISSMSSVSSRTSR